MRRFCIKEMEDWFQSKDRKPLLLDGARQVGKTWLLKEFGHSHFKSTAYVSFDKEDYLCDVFSGGANVKRLLSEISVATDQDIVPGETLIILDEIQKCPAAITSLKYFCEDAPEYAVAAAGSLLGLSSNYGSGFPVGKTEGLNIYPMTFPEFLTALGEERLLAKIEEEDWEVVSHFGDRLERRLRQYLYVGGMPEAVKTFADGENYLKARTVQKKILKDYERDFAKHATDTSLLDRLHEVWDAIPRLLANENRRFIFGAVREGGRGRDFEMALRFLKEAGLAYAVKSVSKPLMPLCSYAESNFKLYGLDVGLLSAKCGLAAKVLLEKNRVFQEYKGALTEQYVQQELRAACGFEPYYWKNAKGDAEVDFIIQNDMGVIPIEAKAERNLKAKSLNVYCDKFSPTLAFKVSMADYHENPGLVSLPLYAVSQLAKIADRLMP